MKEERSSATKPCTRFKGFKGGILRSKGRVRGRGERGRGGGGEGESGRGGTPENWENLPSSDGHPLHPLHPLQNPLPNFHLPSKAYP